MSTTHQSHSRHYHTPHTYRSLLQHPWQAEKCCTQMCSLRRLLQSLFSDWLLCMAYSCAMFNWIEHDGHCSKGRN